jgi:choline dehydrogenase-like flavoprotein
LLDAAAASGYPLTDDYNTQPVGFGRTQFSIHNGRRDTAYRAYLHPVRKRPNLTVVTHALALRILIEHGAARSVVYRRGDGAVETARADREVILSGGSLNTPQLLMLSGIGPADQLRRLGIAPLVDLPVGSNLQDHVKGMLLWKRREPRGPFHRLMRYDRVALAFARAYLFGTGPAATVPLNVQGYIKSDSSLEVPDLEFMLRLAPLGVGPWFPKLLPAYADAFGLDPVLLHPESRGTVRLRSADPTARVRIEYNYLSAPADIAKLREGFRRSREIANRPELNEYRAEELTPGARVVSDDDIDAHLRATSTTVSHPCGTCRMGSDEDSVVDPALRVRGVSALRVVDASVFPDLISAHTNAAVFMIAERAADLIIGTAASSGPPDEATNGRRMMVENTV